MKGLEDDGTGSYVVSVFYVYIMNLFQILKKVVLQLMFRAVMLRSIIVTLYYWTSRIKILGGLRSNVAMLLENRATTLTNYPI